MGSPAKTRKPNLHPETRPPVLVLGVGNILVQDEGVGVRVVEAMREVQSPGEVELFDGGTAGADLIDEVSERRKVIVIDAVQSEEPPGTIFRLTPADFASQRAPVTSLHQVGFLETLRMTEHLGCAPEEVIIFGVTPKNLAWGDRLSQEVAEVIPKLIELISAELGM